MSDAAAVPQLPDATESRLTYMIVLSGAHEGIRGIPPPDKLRIMRT